MRKLFLIILFICSAAARSEIYHGIASSSSLGDIKKQFPNATIVKVKAAWVPPSEGFYLMTGIGLGGSVYLDFYDSRPVFATLAMERANQAIPLRRLPDSDEKTAQLKELDERVAKLNAIANRADDEALTVAWVRWVPTSPIPIQRFVAKYGKPSRTDFDNNNMEPYSIWTARALSAKLSDDLKFVFSVDYGFTEAEKTSGCRSKWGTGASC